MTFPLLFTVGLHTYSAGGDDGYGNPLPVFTPPKDQPGVPYSVCGWVASVADVAEQSGGLDRVITDLDLYAPDSFPATPYALIDVDGVQYEVIGNRQGYNNGPWWAPGLQVWNLRNVAG